MRWTHSPRASGVMDGHFSECVLCQIVSGEVRAKVLYEDDLVVALDIPKDHPVSIAPAARCSTAASGDAVRPSPLRCMPALLRRTPDHTEERPTCATQ